MTEQALEVLRAQVLEKEIKRKNFIEAYRKRQELELEKALWIFDHDAEFKCIFLSGEITISVTTMEEVHEARVALRKIFGSWEDRVTSISGNQGGFAVHFQSETCPVDIMIWANFKELPEGMLKPGCKVIKTPRTGHDYSVVCDIHE